MSKILSTALFASCAAAQLTTSAWMPGTGDSDISYEASVIKVEDDRTTLSLAVKGLSDMTDLVDSMAQTVTLAGNTYYAFNGAAAEAGVTISITGECSRKNTDEESATCSISTKGLEEAMSSACAEAGASEEMCASGVLQPSTSTTLPKGYFTMAQIVVTAGADSLPSASAAATPSVGSASPTASGASNSGKPTASGSDNAAASGASKTSQAAPQSTNAAPLMTMVPALAGLGAAAAFFL
ncbi:hypothetical protein yc1106_07551 [Curvularia clavata]|uniref:Uncharacterized protein n=1 Tax=Curvularia clavata TaxID=95742 RepID=A0A9Q8ZBT8_CURCL|nr:hypothetical protein yc1106_07551 [Curvularia clavata]